MFNDKVDDVVAKYDVSKPLPLGGAPGQVTIQAEFFFNHDLEYLRSGNKLRTHALSIINMKASLYKDAGLEQLVPDDFWIKEESEYDTAAALGISHWWYMKQKFYIERFQAPGDRKFVRSSLQIITVVSVEIHPIYGYDYLKSIVLRRADSNDYKILEGDFKHLCHNDFEDLYLLHLQGKLHHLNSRDKKTLVFAVLQWIRGLVIRKRVE